MLVIKLTTSELVILSLFKVDANRSVYNPDLNLSGKAYGLAVRSLKRRGFLVSTKTPLKLTKRGKLFAKMSTHPPTSEPYAITINQFLSITPGTAISTEDGRIYINSADGGSYEIVLALQDLTDPEAEVKPISELRIENGDLLEEGDLANVSCNEGMF